MAKLTDSILNRITYSECDVENRPIRITTTEGASHMCIGQVWYEEFNNLKTFKEWLGTGKTQFRTDFTYVTENKPTKLTYSDDYVKLNVRRSFHEEADLCTICPNVNWPAK